MKTLFIILARSVKNVTHMMNLRLGFIGGKKENKFVKSSDDDVCTVHVDQVKAILPPPLSSGSTARTKVSLPSMLTLGKLC